MRWWSALASLRSPASSPAAAAATLRTRAASADTETVEEADTIGRRTVLDLTDDESISGGESSDLTPGSDTEDETDEGKKNRRRLLDMVREAEALMGAKGQKLQNAIKIVGELIAEGFHPRNTSRMN